MKNNKILVYLCTVLVAIPAGAAEQSSQQQLQKQKATFLNSMQCLFRKKKCSKEQIQTIMAGAVVIIGLLVAGGFMYRRHKEQELPKTTAEATKSTAEESARHLENQATITSQISTLPTAPTTPRRISTTTAQAAAITPETTYTHLSQDQATKLHEAAMSILRDANSRLVRPKSPIATKHRETLKDAITTGLIDAKFRFSTGYTILHYAVMANDQGFVAQLLDAKADIDNQENHNRNTPLHIAAQYGYESMAQQLIDRGADKTLKDRYGLTPLVMATRLGHSQDMLKLLQP